MANMRVPRYTSPWEFATVSSSPPGGEAVIATPSTNGRRSMTVRIVSEEWEHLRPAGFKPRAIVCFRTHAYNTSGYERVEVQLASVLLGKKVYSALAKKKGGILSGPVPKLQVTTVQFPRAVDDWPERLRTMSMLLANGNLPSLVQDAIGTGVSLHGYDDILEITGPIANKLLFQKTFSIDNKNKAGYLAWTCGKTGPRNHVEEEVEERYCRTFFKDLFIYIDQKATQLENLAKRNNDKRLARAVVKLCFSRRFRCKHIRSNEMTTSMINFRMVLETFKLLRTRWILDLPEILANRMIERYLETLWRSQGIDPNEFQARKEALGAVARRLLRSSKNGPDVPLHVVCHGPNDSKPRCVLVQGLLDEVVIGMATILCLLFGSGDMPSTISNPFDAMYQLGARENRF
jgi:hypothetical protein